jgi:hypothetical protein
MRIHFRPMTDGNLLEGTLVYRSYEYSLDFEYPDKYPRIGGYNYYYRYTPN